MTAAEHTLIRDGWPHYAGVLTGQVFPRDLPYSVGSALCSCTWTSAPLPTTDARKAAHAQHVTEEQP